MHPALQSQVLRRESLSNFFVAKMTRTNFSYPLFHPSSRRQVPITLSRADFKREFTAENDFAEFKSGTSQKPLQDSAVAFSNANGGVILIGVDDNGGVLGRPLEPGTADAIHEALGNVHDVGRYELHQLHIDDVPVTVVAISRRIEGFSQNSKGVVLVRKGTRDQPLFGTELQRFINQRASTRFESTRTDVPVSAANQELLENLAAVYKWTSGDVTSRLDEHGYSINGRLTVAGNLFLTEDPARDLGKTFVDLLRFRNDDTADYDRREEISGPIHHQLEHTVDRIMDELGTQLVVIGAKRFEIPVLPVVVVREAVANALAHRSYEVKGMPVRIEMRPGYVRIISPGGFPEPVTEQNIRETNSARNLHVINGLRRFGLAEDAGRGVDVMQDKMKEEMLDPPRFIGMSDRVEVVLPIRSAVTSEERAWIRELESRGTLRGHDRLLLVHAARGETLTNSAARKILQVDTGAARDSLQRLRDEGFLTQQGERGGAAYTLSGTLQPPAGLRLPADELGELVLRLAENEPVTNARVREATGLDRIQSLRVLRDLVEAGRLVQIGERRGAKYQLPD